jgi:hypothetical protein
MTNGFLAPNVPDMRNGKKSLLLQEAGENAGVKLRIIQQGLECENVTKKLSFYFIKW